MSEPKEPPYTCPSIDSVITCLDELIRRGGAMEEIRDQNEALRSYGNYWKARAEEAEDELGDTQTRLEKAEDRISELENELEEALQNA